MDKKPGIRQKAQGSRHNVFPRAPYALSLAPVRSKPLLHMDQASNTHNCQYRGLGVLGQLAMDPRK
jgi:hypothetical protein